MTLESTQPVRVSPTPTRTEVDPRGLRFTAVVTSVVLAVALATLGTPLATALIGVQAVVFVLGTVLGPARSPYGLVFRHVIRPRIGPPEMLEDARPPRFAQAVGATFTVVALAAALLGADVVAAVATGFALAAALLNATIGFCLGCELYLVARRAVAAL